MTYNQPNYEPLAIVGIGVRLPGGVNDVSSLWQLLRNKTDAICDVPPDRWNMRRFYDSNPEKPGKLYARQAGFLQEDITKFDPLFFGISPREAASMDPQQRVLLEVTWEAFEDAGIDPIPLAGSPTGVFIGGFCLDNLITQLNPLNKELVNTATGTGTTMAILSNRISYIFDFRGPSVSMDTACSSSLVATHFACQSLWNKECELAIAGGVNIMLRPEFPTAMSKGKFLSQHARCKAFDEDAGGYVRAEGAAVFILKPLSKALADNDLIYASILATGVNQDGHTPGISMPNAHAQEALIRSTYQKAGVTPGQVQYIEAHGTGTQAGDPAEAQALNNALSLGRKAENKCWVGSIKTNIGHLEAAAGAAGLIKAALTLHHKEIMPNLHFETPNPKIPFSEYCLSIPTAITPFPQSETPAMAGVNSFGYGGTNAHVLLREAPNYQPQPTILPTFCEPMRYALPLSARSPQALAQLAQKYAAHIEEQPEAKLPDILYSSVFRRSSHPHRLVAIAENKKQLQEQLLTFAKGALPKGVASGVAGTHKIAFVFTGMGPQWWGMGREMYAQVPLFRKVIDRCDALLLPIAGFSIREELLKPEELSRITETQFAQPANFILQVALLECWKSLGVSPDGVVGHSIGEVGSAYASGAITLEEGLLISYHRSRLQKTVAGLGGMLAVGMPHEEITELLEGLEGVSVAAINSPSSVTLAGLHEELSIIAGEMENVGIFNRTLQVEVAYHSYQMDSLQAPLLESLASLSPRATVTPLYSTVTGAGIEGKELTPHYWWQNVRQPVHFAAAIQTMIQEGYTLFVEVGPHPALKNSIQECLQKANAKGFILPSLKRGEPEVTQMLETLGALYTLGVPINWETITPKGNFIKFPSYPWQKESYWNESAASIAYRLGRKGHPFMNSATPCANPSFEAELNTELMPFLNDHCIQGSIVFPGAGYIEAALALQNEMSQETTITLEDIQFHQLLVIEPAKVQEMQTAFHPQSRQFTVHSRIREENSSWQLHASGRILPEVVMNGVASLNISNKKAQLLQVSAATLYQELRAQGLEYGPWFQTIQEIWRGDNEVLVKLAMQPDLSLDSEYLLPPNLLDGGFQAFVTALSGNAQFSSPVVPVSIGRVTLYQRSAPTLWAHCQITQVTANSLKGDLTLFNEDGQVIAKVKKLKCQALQFGDAQEKDSPLYYQFQWVEQAPPEAQRPPEGNWLIVSAQTEFEQSLNGYLQFHQANVITVTHNDNFRKVAENKFSINLESSEDWKTLLQSVNAPINYVLYALPLSADPTEPNDVFSLSWPLISFSQALVKTGGQQNTLIAVISRGAVSVLTEDPVQPSAAALEGLCALLPNEHPNIQTIHIDLPSKIENAELDFLFKEILNQAPAQNTALRQQKRYVKELKSKAAESASETVAKPVVNTRDQNVRLRMSKTGTIEGLHYQMVDRRRPAPNEVEIQVHASALNFKDVLKVFGQLDPRATEGTFIGDTFGMEVSGVITQVGQDVKDFKVGDPIITGAMPDSFVAYAYAPTTYLVRKPESLSFEQAPILLVFLTAYHSLVNVAQLQKGEKILIHNAAGGVGLAAIQIAKWKGAEIFATAGTAEKREYLRNLGVDHVLPSRSLQFFEEVMRRSHGYGVDVVINATSGEKLFKSLELLAPYGRFIEIGKKDIMDNAGLPLKFFNENLQFTSIDGDRMFIQRVALCQDILRNVIKGFNEGYFQALPTTAYPAAQAQDAFRHMAQGTHIGKIVLNFFEQEVEALAAPESKSLFSQNGAYLVTGGNSGFGLAVAEWIAKQGGGAIITLSRSGASQEAEAVFARLRAQGTTVISGAVDVSNEAQLREFMTANLPALPPLRGVFHAAMVLEDAFLQDLTPEAMRKVLQPKVTGAYLLHQLTLSAPLDYFICFSSISSVVGNVGQANYVLANSYLDHFAFWRKSQNLPALTINWGVLGETGVAARNQKVMSVLESVGVKAISTKKALAALGALLAQENGQVGVFEVDWSRWGQNYPQAVKGTRLAQLLSGPTRQKARPAVVDSILLAAAESERLRLVWERLKLVIAKILRISPSQIEPSQNMASLGIDSLMALELRYALETEFAISVNMMEIMKGQSAEQLAQTLLAKIVAENASSKSIDELSEEELDKLLLTL